MSELRVGDRPCHRVPIADFGDEPALDHRLGQFFDEQRYAVGTVDNLLGDLLGQGLARRSRADHLGALPRRQPIERQQGDVWAADPRRRKLRAEGDDREDAVPGHAIDQQIEGLCAWSDRTNGRPRTPRAPALAADSPSTCASERRQRLLLALLRREVEREVALAKRYREQIGEQRRNRANIVGRLRYHHFEFVQPLLQQRPRAGSRRPARGGQ